MATKINTYLNDQAVNPPKNLKELAIELNFDKDSPDAAVTLNEFDFVRENSSIINSWLNQGKVFEGLPLRIEIERNGQIEKPFDGYIDLTENAQISCNRSTVTAKERGGIDWLNDVADSVSYEYLHSIGKITDKNYVQVPYVINSVPAYTETAVAIVSVYVIGSQLSEVIQKLKELIAALSNPLDFSAIIRCFLYVSYITILIAAMIKLLRDIADMFIQPVKYHSAMRVKDLLTIGAEHFGYTVKCEEFETGQFSKAVIMPEKFFIPRSKKDSRLLGYLDPVTKDQSGYFKGTFGDLLRLVKKIIRGKIFVTKNKELIIVRDNYNPFTPQYQLPPMEEDYFTINADQIKSNYMVEFLTDGMDKNTVLEYKGASYQVIMQPQSSTELALTKGLETVTIPLALAKVKQELTVPEKIIKVFLEAFGLLLNALIVTVNAMIKVVNAVIKALNKIIKALKVVGIKINVELKTISAIQAVSPGDIIKNRIGMMMLETDQTSVAKIFLLDEGGSAKNNKIAKNNGDVVSAKNLYKNYHYSHFNLSVTREFEKAPFCFNDYLKVKDSNKIFTPDGKEAEILSLLWTPEMEQAKMRVKYPAPFPHNLKTIELEPDGR
jgi:hypothetical protein